MLSLPKAPFLAVGLLEALGAATGMAAGGNAHFIMLLFASWDYIYGHSWLLNSKCFALYDSYSTVFPSNILVAWELEIQKRKTHPG